MQLINSRTHTHTSSFRQKKELLYTLHISARKRIVIRDYRAYKEGRKKEPLWWGELSIDQAKERERPDGNVVQRKKIIKASRRAKKKG